MTANSSINPPLRRSKTREFGKLDLVPREIREFIYKEVVEDYCYFLGINDFKNESFDLRLPDKRAIPLYSLFPIMEASPYIGGEFRRCFHRLPSPESAILKVRLVKEGLQQGFLSNHSLRITPDAVMDPAAAAITSFPEIHFELPVAVKYPSLPITQVLGKGFSNMINRIDTGLDMAGGSTLRRVAIRFFVLPEHRGIGHQSATLDESLLNVLGENAYDVGFTGLLYLARWARFKFDYPGRESLHKGQYPMTAGGMPSDVRVP